MGEDAVLQSRIASTEVETLTPVVRAILDDEQALPLGPLSVQRIGRSGGIGTAGIFRVSGEARDSAAATHPWSAVLKVVHPSARPEGVGQGFVDPAREVAAYRSGMFANAVGGFRSVACYLIDSHSDGSDWLWLEDLSHAPPPPWPSGDYYDTARHLGQFNGNWTGLADGQTWLLKDAFQARFGRPDTSILDGLPPDSPTTRSMSPKGLERVKSVWQESAPIYAALPGIPSHLCHTDAHAKNMSRVPNSDGRIETVAFDWATVGYGLLGMDPANLLVSGLRWLEIDSERARTLEPGVFAAYVEGLDEAGWAGDVDLARFGFALTISLTGVSMCLNPVRWGSNPRTRELAEQLLGIPFDDLVRRWAEPMDFYFSFHEEAKSLARRLLPGA
ncbi:MAG: hypothetical protein HY678_12215 [Chloroflexi bacterium]|nr:hypothetical protein [Chloroflexota bacterium]